MVYILTFVMLIVLIIIIAIILNVKDSKNKEDSSKIDELQEKIQKYENLYPTLKNYEHKQHHNNDAKNNLGINGENIVKRLLKNLEKQKNLELLNNLYLSSYQKKVKQIDHLLIANDSLFVIETKNWRIATYGDRFQENWIQYQNDKKVFVPSPIYQNNRSVETICDILKQHGINLNNFNIYNVVVFVQNNLKMK